MLASSQSGSKPEREARATDSVAAAARPTMNALTSMDDFERLTLCWTVIQVRG